LAIPLDSIKTIDMTFSGIYETVTLILQ